MTSSGAAGRAGVAATAAALAMVLTGCLKVDTALTIEAETVSGTLVAAIAADDLAPLGITPEEIFADQDAGLGGVAGVTSEPYEQGRWSGTQYTLDQVAIEELNEVSEGDPDGLRIIQDKQAGTYEFQLVIDLTFIDNLDPTELDDPELADLDLTQLREGFEVTVAVTFPAAVLEHNGELAGRTVSWQPPAGERSELRALGAGAGDAAAGAAADEPDPAAGAGAGGASGWWLIGLVAVGLLAAAGIAVAMLAGRRRNRTASPELESGASST